MGLHDIATRIDEALDRAGDHAEVRQAQFLESDANRMAHHIVAYVLERAQAGHDPYDLGKSMVEGAFIGEDESGGELASPVVTFLESVLDGAQAAISERQGADVLYHDPVAHCVQYYLAHNKWPSTATPRCIAAAKAALAAGQRGQNGRKNAALGLYL